LDSSIQENDFFSFFTSNFLLCDLFDFQKVEAEERKEAVPNPQARLAERCCLPCAISSFSEGKRLKFNVRNRKIIWLFKAIISIF
jgi:hypothetical protein